MRLLLVDDEESIRKLGTKTLTRFGYTVLTAESGEEGLELFRWKKQVIDLVVLDFIMPGMGGRRCLEELLGLDPKAKVIIASGYSINGPIREAFETGARGFISKPFEVGEMLRVVRTVLDETS